MHYCIAVITKTFPTDSLLNTIMSPYNEEDFYEKDEHENLPYPTFMWDWWQIGGRYAGEIKLKINEDDSEYNWGFYVKESRAGKLFRSFLLEKMQKANIKFYSEEDYFTSMGYRDGFLYVDGAKIKDIQNIEELNCFSFIDKNGNAFTRSYYNRGEFIKNFNFDEQFQNALKDSQDCYIIFLDIHD